MFGGLTKEVFTWQVCHLTKALVGIESISNFSTKVLIVNLVFV